MDEWARSSRRGPQPDWAHLAPHLLDGIKSAMAEHEGIALLRCGRLVNHHWCQWAAQATKSLEIWHTRVRLECVVRRYTAVEKLTIEQSTNPDLAQLKRLPLLKELNLAFGVSPGLEVEHVRCLTALTNLTLEGPDHSDKLVSTLLNLTRLKKLKLTGGISITDESLNLLASLSGLTAIDLSGSNQISNGGIRCLASMPSLKQVHLARHSFQGWSYSSDVTAILGKMTGLVVLGVAGCRHISDAGVAHLKDLTNLTELHLPLRTSITGLQALAELTAISHLSLCSAKKLDDDVLGLLTQFRGLSVLAVDFTDWRRERQPIERVPGIGDVTGLVDLTLIGSRYWGEDIRFLTSLTALTTLRLCSFSFLEGWDLFALTALTALKALDMSCCWRIGDTEVGFVSSLTRLTDLCLFNCYKVTDYGVEKLAALTGLTNLNLAECHRISDMALRTVGRLSALALLDLRGCQNVTTNGTKACLRPLRFLRIVRT